MAIIQTPGGPETKVSPFHNLVVANVDVMKRVMLDVLTTTTP